MCSKPLITTVIPTYRRPKLLRRAIRSVLAQTYPHFQVSVYDNASGDETPAVVGDLAKADPRVKYHCHPENIGAFRNFVYGMERVDTPFFSFLSDDDVILPHFFQKALEGFERYPEAAFSALLSLQVDEKGQVTAEPLLGYPAEGFYPPPEGLLTMLKRGNPAWTAILFRREVMEKVGILDEETGGPSDRDYELRVAARCATVFSRDVGALFLSHPGPRSTEQSLESLWPCYQKMIHNLREDEHLSLEVRLFAQESLLRAFRREHIALGGLAFVVNKNWREADQAAVILRDHYHLRTRALLLKALAWAAQRLPPAYSLMCYLNALRKSLKPPLNRRLQSKYGAYARYRDMGF